MDKSIGFIKKEYKPYGGAERYLAMIMERMVLEGYQVHLYASKWTGLREGITVHRVRNLRLGSAASALSFNRNVRASVSRQRPDCLMSFERTTSGEVYRAGDGVHRQWLRLRRSVEGTVKGLSFGLNPLHRALLSIEREIFEKTPIIVANSNMVKREIIEHYGVPEKRLRVIHNGVDLEGFNPRLRDSGQGLELKRQMGINEKTKILLFVGTGFERKGLGVLLEALALLKADEPVLLVAGRGRLMPYEQQCARLGLQRRVRFLGPTDEIARLYAASDLFVLPTLYDPFSNATIEAMASGLGVVTTSNNGASELIEESVEGCITHELASAPELAQAMERALMDSEAMGLRARAKAEQYPIEKAVAAFIALLKECGTGG